MGPSGCGKTTCLNVLARRPATSGAKVHGDSFINGTKVDTGSFGRMTSYVEQEDALIGSLTVRETLKFAADLSLPRCVFNAILDNFVFSSSLVLIYPGLVLVL